MSVICEIPSMLTLNTTRIYPNPLVADPEGPIVARRCDTDSA